MSLAQEIEIVPPPDLEAQRALTEAAQKTTHQVIPLVFHRDGKPIKDFRSAWKTACTNAGLPGRIPHDFRRTAVRNLERAAISRSVAMKLTGHETEAQHEDRAHQDGVGLAASLERGRRQRVAALLVVLGARVVRGESQRRTA